MPAGWQLSLAENAEAAKRRAESRASQAVFGGLRHSSRRVVSIREYLISDPKSWISSGICRKSLLIKSPQISPVLRLTCKTCRDLPRGATKCLLLAPIRVLSDSDLEPERRFTPPPTNAPEVWGNEIALCHVGANHYEATAPLAEGRGNVEADPKRIKLER